MPGPMAHIESEWLKGWIAGHGGVLTIEKRLVVVG